jgi:hypothetical protein
MAFGPDWLIMIGGRLIILGPAGQGGLRIIAVKRVIGRERIKTAAAHVVQLIDQHIANRAQFPCISSLSQDAGRTVTAAIAKYGKVHLDQGQPLQMRQ